MQGERRPLLTDYSKKIAIRTLYSDMDGFRHINGGATGRYFEEGRADFNMAVFGVECLIAPGDGLQLLFAKVAVDYLGQAHYPGMIEVGTAVAKVGRSSYVLTQAAFQNDLCYAVAETTIVRAVDGRAVPLPERERAALCDLMVADNSE